MCVGNMNIMHTFRRVAWWRSLEKVKCIIMNTLKWCANNFPVKRSRKAHNSYKKADEKIITIKVLGLTGNRERV